MKNLMVARRDGTLRNRETGERYALVRGKTLAHEDHPAVTAYPEAWMPMVVALRTEGEPADPDRVPSVDLDDARAEADGYRKQLAIIAEGLAARGLVDEHTDTSREGWLAETVFGAIDRQRAGADDEPEPDNATIRQWARENGFTVADRGALPAEVREAYRTAH